MMASAAIAISSVLGTEVEIGTPGDARPSTSRPRRSSVYPTTPHAVRATLHGLRRAVPARPARPERVRRPHDARARRARVRADAGGSTATARAARARPPARRRRAVPRSRHPRARLGRARPHAACRPPRSSACRPARWSSSTRPRTSRSTSTSTDTLFATGRLMVVDGTDWAVRIETVLSPANTSNELEAGGGPMARVLVVDDAAFMRKMVSDALTKGGHEVVGEAGNGVEAIARYPGAQARGHDARHHDAREGRPLRPARRSSSSIPPPA